MHRKIISDKTLENILYELNWIVFNTTERTAMTLTSRDITLFLKIAQPVALTKLPIISLIRIYIKL